MASLAGSLFASYITFIDPTQFVLFESIFILAIIILGGLANLKGSVCGALFLILLPEILRFVGFFRRGEKNSERGFQFRRGVGFTVECIEKRRIVGEAAHPRPIDIRLVVQKIEPLGTLREIFFPRLLNQFIQVCAIVRENHER